MSLRFLNIDLELETKRKPDRLLRDLGTRVNVLLHGPSGKRGLLFTSLETAASRRTPATAMREFARLVSALSDAGKKEWAGAVQRTFDIGFQVSEEEQYLSLALDPEVMETAVRLGATIAITFYRV